LWGIAPILCESGTAGVYRGMTFNPSFDDRFI